jgi:hypothetical protein
MAGRSPFAYKLDYDKEIAEDEARIAEYRDGGPVDVAYRFAEKHGFLGEPWLDNGVYWLLQAALVTSKVAFFELAFDLGLTEEEAAAQAYEIADGLTYNSARGEVDAAIAWAFNLRRASNLAKESAAAKTNLPFMTPAQRHIALKRAKASLARHRRNQKLHGNPVHRRENPANTLSMLPKGAKITLTSDWEPDEPDEDGISIERNILEVLITSRGEELAHVWASGIPGIDYEIASADAEHGWGPLAYDILMEMVTHVGSELGPGDSSPAAQRVWEHYATKRTDVEKSPDGFTFRKEPKLLYELARMPNVLCRGDWETMRLENPRPLPLDEEKVGAFAHAIVEDIDLAILPSEYRPGRDIGPALLVEKWVGPEQAVVRRIRGGAPEGIILRVKTVESAVWDRDVVAGAVNTVGFSDGTTWKAVSISLRADKTPHYYRKAIRSGSLEREIRRTLSHELRHVSQATRHRRTHDVTENSSDEAFAEYLNDPREVEARLGDLVADLRHEVANPDIQAGIRDGFYDSKQKLFDHVLANSHTWRQMRDLVTEKNRRKLLQVAYTALEPDLAAAGR